MNLEGLKKFQSKKREDSRSAILKAIEKLKQQGKPVNFKSVSDVSKISRKTLYKVDEFAALIKEHRGDDEENKYLEIIRKQKEEIASLKAEIERLKNQSQTDNKNDIKDKLASLKESLLKK